MLAFIDCFRMVLAVCCQCSLSLKMEIYCQQGASTLQYTLQYVYCVYSKHLKCTDLICSSVTANITSVVSRIKGSCHCIFHVTYLIDWTDNCNDHRVSRKKRSVGLPLWFRRNLIKYFVQIFLVPVKQIPVTLVVR